MTDIGAQIGFWSDSPAGRVRTAAGSILNRVCVQLLLTLKKDIWTCKSFIKKKEENLHAFLKGVNLRTLMFWTSNEHKTACNSFPLVIFNFYIYVLAEQLHTKCAVYFNEPAICRALRIKAFVWWGEKACSWSNFLWLHTTQAICTTLGTSLSCSSRYILIGMSKIRAVSDVSVRRYGVKIIHSQCII